MEEGEETNHTQWTGVLQIGVKATFFSAPSSPQQKPKPNGKFVKQIPFTIFLVLSPALPINMNPCCDLAPYGTVRWVCNTVAESGTVSL